MLCAILAYLIWSPTIAAAHGSTARIDRLAIMESTGPVYDVLYRSGHLDPARDGSYGPNVHVGRGLWYLEYQRAAGYDLFAGVVRDDFRLIAEGLRMINWGLAREARDGSFPGSHSPFHGTAMFLSETAPALVLVRASRYGVHFRREINWEIERMQRAAYYLERTVGGPGRLDDPTKNHRYFEAALAFGAVGVLAGDARLRQWSSAYAWNGIAMQRGDGVMPEDGGHDSGYQALGMVNAARYLDLVASGALRRALWQALRKGEAWELSRVSIDGSIDQSGDTRTAGCRERDLLGHCKTTFYAPIYSALAHWARIFGDLRYAAAAFLVWERSGYGAVKAGATQA